MVFCFIKGCEKQFSDSVNYKCHLKIKHLLKSRGEFVCTALDCDETFSRIDNFMRHLNIRHQIPKSTSENSINQSPVPLPDIFEDISCDLTQPVEEHSYPEVTDFKRVLEENFLNFLIKLHTKGNVTKKLAIEIFNDLMHSIIDPILGYTKADDLTKNEILKTYSSMNTLYKFEKVMTEKNLLKKAKKIVVNNRVETGW